MRLNDEWKWMFSPQILERARNYFREERVDHIQRLGDWFFAEVKGSSNYQVLTQVEDDQVVKVGCNCPYSKNGYLCKHEAALLMELENSSEEELENYQLLPKEEIKRQEQSVKTPEDLRKEKEALSFMRTAQGYRLQDLVEKAIISIPEFRDFVLEYSQGSHSEYKFEEKLETLNQALRNQVSILQLIKENSHYENLDTDFDSYLMTNMDYVYKVFKNFFDLFEELFYKNQITESAYLNSKILDVFDRLPDSYKFFSTQELLPDFEEIYLNMWLDFLAQQDDFKRVDFIDEFKNYGDRAGNFYELLISTFIAEPERIDWLIELYKLQTDLPQSREAGKKTIKQFVENLSNKYGETALKKLRAAFPDYIEFRIERIKEYIQEQNVFEALDLIQRSRVLDKENRELKGLYTTLLIEIYAHTNQKDKLKEELTYYFDIINDPDKKYLFKLRETLSTDEWNLVKGKYFKKVGYLFTPKEEMEFYLEENMREEIRKLIKKRTFFSVYFDFEERLRNQFPDEIRDRLIEEIDLEVNMYRISDTKYLIRLLNTLQFYPYGIDFVQDIVRKIKTKYSTDTYLKQLLEENGF